MWSLINRGVMGVADTRMENCPNREYTDGEQGTVQTRPTFLCYRGGDSLKPAGDEIRCLSPDLEEPVFFPLSAWIFERFLTRPLV
jgi:hypothetical protein